MSISHDQIRSLELSTPEIFDPRLRSRFPRYDQAQPRYSMYLLKAYALPEIYWNGMLRGRM